MRQYNALAWRWQCIPFSGHWKGVGHMMFCTMNQHVQQSAFCLSQFQVGRGEWLSQWGYCDKSLLHIFEDGSHHHSKLNSEYGCINSKLCGACLLRDNYLFSGIFGCTPNTYLKCRFAIAIITERASCDTVFCLHKDKPSYLGYPVNNWSYKCTNALRHSD